MLKKNKVIKDIGVCVFIMFVEEESADYNKVGCNHEKNLYNRIFKIGAPHFYIPRLITEKFEFLKLHHPVYADKKYVFAGLLLYFWCL